MRFPNEAGNLGKYDEVCEEVMAKTEAATVLVIVLGGNKGAGFSVSTSHPRNLIHLPEVLELVARNIRAQQGAARDSGSEPA